MLAKSCRRLGLINLSLSAFSPPSLAVPILRLPLRSQLFERPDDAALIGSSDARGFNTEAIARDVANRHFIVDVGGNIFLPRICLVPRCLSGIRCTRSKSLSGHQYSPLRKEALHALEPLGSGCRIRKGEQRQEKHYHNFTVGARAEH
jgi:hypothetical protein